MTADILPPGPAPVPGAPAPGLIPLDALPRHTPARVVDLAPSSDQTLLLRLMEIGFLPGEPVRIVAAGFPGGDPLAVRVGQATFALRRHEASLVRVSVVEGGA
ncbi:hypothetical protein GCM10027082_28250 [Comamonas humi]